MNQFWTNYGSFAEFLFTHVPLLSNYTLKQKQRILSCFHEEDFNPGQHIFRERGELDYVYIIIDG